MQRRSWVGRTVRRGGRVVHRLLLWNSLGLLLLLAFPAFIHAQQVTLAWDDPNPEGVVDGYRVYYKTGSSGNRVLANYDGSGLTFVGAPYDGQPVDSGFGVERALLPNPDAPAVTLDGLNSDEAYYFVVTAYAGSLESDASNEASTAHGAIASLGGCFIVTAEAEAMDPTRRPLLLILLAIGGVVLAAVVGWRKGKTR